MGFGLLGRPESNLCHRRQMDVFYFYIDQSVDRKKKKFFIVAAEKEREEKEKHIFCRSKIDKRRHEKK